MDTEPTITFSAPRRVDPARIFQSGLELPHRRKVLGLDFLVSALLSLALSAQAVNIITNGSFDADTVAPSTGSGAKWGQTFTNLTGWTKATGTTANLNLANGAPTGRTSPPYWMGNGSTIPYVQARAGNTFLDCDNGTIILQQTMSVSGLGTVSVSYNLCRFFGSGATGSSTAQVELFDGADTNATRIYDSTVINVSAQNAQTWVSYAPAAVTNAGSSLCIRLTLSDNVTVGNVGIDNVVVDYQPVFCWSGTTDGNWSDSDTTSLNFTGTNFAYVKGLVTNVFFRDTDGSGTPVARSAITIGSGGVSGVNALFNNNAVNYTLSSADAAGISGACGVTMNGSGTVTFSGPNTYTGSTTINQGTLFLSGHGSLASTSIVLGARTATFDISAASGTSLTSGTSGQTLQGIGTVNGPLTVAPGATLTVAGAGAGPLDALTNNGNLTLKGNTVLRINKSGSTLTADQIVLPGASGVTYGGTLTVVSNAGSATFGLSDKFTLFAQGSGAYHGTFASSNLPPLAGTLVWDTSGLAVDGSIAVGGVPPPPVVLGQPQSATYLVGGMAEPLTITATSLAPVSYQWCKDGTNLPFAADAAYSPPAPLTLNDAGDYTVIVSNAGGSTTSSPPATITVLNVPSDAERATANVRRYQAVFTSPPVNIPSTNGVDGPLLGNGDMLAALGGQAGVLQFYISRNDLWNLASTTALPKPLSWLDVSLTGLQGGSFNVQQDFLHGLTTGRFTNNIAAVSMQAAVASTSNLLWVLLSTTNGSVSGRADLYIAGTSNAPPAGATLVVERDFTNGVTVANAAASALHVVGSSDRTFVITSNQPVLLVVSSESLLVTNAFRNSASNAVANFQMTDLPALLASHLTWWSNFWNESYVEIPNQTLMQRYYLSHYVLACCCRNTNFPPGLHGWVTTDNPRWSGDYHLNYNHQATYYGLYAANHIELASTYTGPYLAVADRGRQLAQSQLGIAGIYLPVGLGPMGTLTVNNFFGQKSDASYSCVPMAQHWYTTRDPSYASGVYPFVRDVAQFWENYLTYTNNYNNVSGSRDVDFNDCVQENTTVGDVNPIFSLGAMRLVLSLALDMSSALNVDVSRQANWRNILTNLSTYPNCTVGDLPSNYWPPQLPHTAAVSNLSVFRYTEVGTAWHENNTCGIQHIYPANAIGLDSPPDMLQRATNMIYVMSRWYDRNGMNSFYPCAARVGYDPNTILSQLTGMVSLWGWPNGFYQDIPNTNTLGGWTENESIVPNTIQEMLMQSHEGVLRFFPCWPTNLDARFGTLRAYGAFLVSAQLQGGVVTAASITSERGQPCTIQNPWPALPVAVTHNGLLGEVVSGTRFTLPTAPNETLALAPATGYDLWAQQIPTPAQRAPSADADGDGYANLLEYVTGGNPVVPDHQSHLAAWLTNGVFELGFTRNTNSTDATILVETTAEPAPGVSWLGVAANHNGIWTSSLPVAESASGNPRSVTIHDTPSDGARYYRLRVTLP
jgi:autotransporter-associated beta strand protein